MRVGAAKINVFGLNFIVFAHLKCIEIVLFALNSLKFRDDKIWRQIRAGFTKHSKIEQNRQISDFWIAKN